MVKETGERFRNPHVDIDGAFDIASGGLGVHLYAVQDFAEGKPLNDKSKTSLSGYSCNYLRDPYVEAWRDSPNPFFSHIKIQHLSPLTPQHTTLLNATENFYQQIEWEQMRVLLGGDDIVLPDAGAPISKEEMRFLIGRATERGLLEVDINNLPPIEPAETYYQLTLNLVERGIPTRVEVSEELGRRAEALDFSDRFRKRMFLAGVYKLGSMLAVTDQLTYDLAQQGNPVPAHYKPIVHRDLYEQNWLKLFGEPMPDIDGLYRQAHGIFTELADPQDPLVAHLFDLPSLPQLAA